MIYKCSAWFDGYSTVAYANDAATIDTYFKNCMADPTCVTALVEACESDANFDGSVILILTPDDQIGTQLTLDDEENTDGLE